MANRKLLQLIQNKLIVKLLREACLVLRHEFVAHVFIWAKFRPLGNSVRLFSIIPPTIHFIKKLFLNLNMGVIWVFTIFKNQFFCFVLAVRIENAYKKWKCMGIFKLGLAPHYLKVSHSFFPILILIKINDKWQIHNPRVKTNPRHTCNLSFSYMTYLSQYISWVTLQLAHSRVETTITVKTQGFHGPITLPHQYPST